MKKKMLNGIRYYFLPIIFGIIFIMIEMTINSLFIYSIKADAICFLILILFSIVIILISKNLKACGIFVVTTCLALLAYLLFGCLSQPNTFMSENSVIIIAINWVAITGTCVILKFFLKEKRIEGFPIFFKISSITFLIFYIYAFSFTFFFDYQRLFMMQFHIRDLNLIPFVKTIIPYITGTAHTNFYTPIINMLSNILLFVPIGFYLGVFSKRLNIGLRISIIVGVPVLVEALQYIFACGTSDIDDVIINSLGGFLGVLVFLGAEKAYRAYQKNSNAKLFVFK